MGLCIVALVLNSTDVNVYRALYGGEDDEAIRFMDTVLSEEKWLAEVESEKHMIEEMPVVKGSVDFFYSDTSANLNKVQASVWCCWAPARRTFKQVLVACDEKEKPTHLEALRALRAKLVSEHMCATHEPHERAVARRRELEASGEAEAAEPANAFDRMRAANARLTLLEKKAAVDERVAELARQTERVAREKREAAEAAAKQSKAAAKAASPQGASGAGPSTAVPMEAAATEQEEEDHEPMWREWTLPRWRKHETELEKRRAVEIDENNTDATLPARGDETRGWRHHRRRGLKGCLRDWAEGSKHRVAFMLAEMAMEFKVVDQVRALVYPPAALGCWLAALLPPPPPALLRPSH